MTSRRKSGPAPRRRLAWHHSAGAALRGTGMAVWRCGRAALMLKRGPFNHALGALTETGFGGRWQALMAGPDGTARKPAWRVGAGLLANFLDTGLMAGGVVMAAQTLPLWASLPVTLFLGRAGLAAVGRAGLTLHDLARHKGPDDRAFGQLSPARQRLERFFCTRRALAHAAGRRPRFHRRPVTRLMTAMAAIGLLLAPGAWIRPDHKADWTSKLLEEARDANPRSAELAGLAARFNKVAGQPLVYLDHDAIDLISGLSGHDGHNPFSTARAGLEALTADSGHRPNPLTAWLLGRAINSRGQSLNLADTRLNPFAEPPCLVAPGDAPDGGEDVVRDLTLSYVQGLRAPDVGPLVAVPPEIAKRFTDYHETGHCLDRVYVPGVTAGLARFLGDDQYMRHKAETLADTHAVLQLARDGWPHAAATFADLRQVYSGRGGPLYATLARGAAPGGRESSDIYGGAVYHTAPVLRAAATLIAQLPPGALRSLPDAGILQLAHRLVEAHDISRAEFDQLHLFHRQLAHEGMGAAVAVLDRPATGNRLLDSYLDETRAAEGRLLGAAPAPTPAAETALAAARAEARSEMGDLARRAQGDEIAFTRMVLPALAGARARALADGGAVSHEKAAEMARLLRQAGTLLDEAAPRKSHPRRVPFPPFINDARKPRLPRPEGDPQPA